MILNLPSMRRWLSKSLLAHTDHDNWTFVQISRAKHLKTYLWHSHLDTVSIRKLAHVTAKYLSNAVSSICLVLIDLLIFTIIRLSSPKRKSAPLIPALYNRVAQPPWPVIWYKLPTHPAIDPCGTLVSGYRLVAGNIQVVHPKDHGKNSQCS